MVDGGVVGLSRAGKSQLISHLVFKITMQKNKI
jgi:predicted YcjX-like family ATPase